MNTLHFFSVAACLTLCACGSKNSSGHGAGASSADLSGVPTADVATAITKPSRLTASQLGSKISFVPLETTDTSLIANKYCVTVSDSKVIISNFGSEPNVLVFDRATGRFLNHVGTFGNGPEDFSNPYHITDRSGSRIFLMPGSGNGLLSFTTDGRPSGSALKKLKNFYPNIIVNDSTIWVGGAKELNDDRGEFYRRVTMDGQTIDSVFVFEGQKLASPFPNSFSGYTDYKRSTPILGDMQQMITQVKNNGRIHINFQPSIYRVEDEIHLRETLCDTIYRVTPGAYSYSLIFDLGTHSFPVEDINSKEASSSNLFITDIVENANTVLFGVSKGWPMDDDHSEFIGLYNRATGQTTISAADSAIEDDISGFVPFTPGYVSTDGAFVGFISPEDVIKWMESHPDAPRPDWAKNLVSDDNPVMVIVSK